MTEIQHNIGSWPSLWASRSPTQPALADAERRLDYAGFEARVAQLAGWLRSHDVGRGDRVALLLGNRTPMLEAVFATARIGALSLPINTRLSAREVCFLLDDCTPAVLLHESSASDLVESACAQAARPPRLRVPVGGDDDAYESLLASATADPRIEAVSPDDPMMLMYTSGTTGNPKGAVLPHRKTLYNSLNAEIFFGIRPRDRVLVVSPLFHSLGLMILALPIIHSGGSLVLQPRFDADGVLEAIASEAITYMGAVPTVYQRLWDRLGASDRDYDLSSLRFLFTAGAAISIELVHAYRSKGLVLKQGYGQTETSILCCLDEQDAVRKAGSVGKPVQHVNLRIVKQPDLPQAPEKWRETEPGEAGEIVVKGPINMLGYWQREAESAETLRGHWLRTGDLATRDEEGFVTLVGRARDMYISGGENVYPAEVESVYADHPAVREIAVLGVRDERWGEVGRAHLVLAPGQDFDEAQLLSWGSERLARFKLPQQFVLEESLPRTASGKVQKHLLNSESL